MYFLKVPKTFEKKLKRFLQKHPDLKEVLKEKLEILQQNPFDPRLKTHKLSGNLKHLFAISITYEYRLVVRIDTEEKLIEFYAIGTHNEVY